MNVLGEEHIELILFSSKNVRRAQAIVAEKEAFEKSERIPIDTKKATQAKKRQRTKAEKAAKALQAVVRAENIDEVRVEEKA